MWRELYLYKFLCLHLHMEQGVPPGSQWSPEPGYQVGYKEKKKKKAFNVGDTQSN